MSLYLAYSELLYSVKAIKSYGYNPSPRGSQWLSLLTNPLSRRFGKFSFKKLTATSARYHLRDFGNLSRALGTSYGRLGKVRREFSRNIDSGWDSSALDCLPSNEDLNSDLENIQNSLSPNDVYRDGILMCGGVLFASIPNSWVGRKIYPFLKFDVIEGKFAKTNISNPSGTSAASPASCSGVGRLVIDLKSVPNTGLLPSLSNGAANNHLWIRMEVSFDKDRSLLFRVRTSPAVDQSTEMSVLISEIVDAFVTKISKITKVRSVHRRTLERHRQDVAAAERLMQLKRLNDSMYELGHSKNKPRRGGAAGGGASMPSRYRPSASTQERRNPRPKGGGG
jgi:hypothetical protein